MFEVVRNSIRQIPRIRLILGLIVALSMVGVLFYVLTPDLAQQQAEVNYDGSVTRFSGTQYVGGTVTPPEDFATFRFLGYVPPTDLQRELITAYGAVVDDLNPEIWRGGGMLIAKINDPERFSVQAEEIDTSASSEFSDKPSTSQDPFEIANAWVNTYLPNHNLVSINTEVEYFNGTYELSPAPKSLATIVLIPYAQLIDRFPIRTNTPDGYPLLIYVNTQKNQVIKAVFYPTIIQFEPTDERVPSISVDEAVQQINSNKKTQVLNAIGAEQASFSLSKLHDGRLTKASIEYRLRADNQLVPYFNFVGTFFDSTNTPVTANVVTPAIQ